MAGRLCPLVLIALLAGCDQPPSFDPATAADVTGVVRWDGPPPDVAPFRSRESPLSDQPSPARDWANPNAPRIDPATGGLAGAVVFLRGIDPRGARPWDHDPVRVELRHRRFAVVQGPAATHIGFVRDGDPVDLLSCEDVFHTVRGRGAAFFALTLPDRGDRRTYRPRVPGVVELSSGCGYFWMRAYLLVSEHPYLARCDARGRFRLRQVPAGDYEAVAWHPDWRVAEQERNPDNFRVQHVRFAPPREAVRRVVVRPGQAAEVRFLLGR